MPAGRPSKLTPEVTKRICQAVKLGATYKLAAQAAGVSEKTFCVWMARGREGGPGSAKFVEFLQAIKDSEGEGAETCLAVIRKAALDGIWTAAAWLLERRYPDLYGRVARAPIESAKDKTDQPTPEEAVNKIREVYGLPPKAEGGGNGHAKAKDDASGG